MQCPDCGTEIALRGLAAHRAGLRCLYEAKCRDLQNAGLEPAPYKAYEVYLNMAGIEHQKGPLSFHKGRHGRRSRYTETVWTLPWAAQLLLETQGWDADTRVALLSYVRDEPTKLADVQRTIETCSRLSGEKKFANRRFGLDFVAMLRGGQ